MEMATANKAKRKTKTPISNKNDEGHEKKRNDNKKVKKQ